jgi:hypothetical protein
MESAIAQCRRRILAAVAHFFLTDSEKFRPRIADGQESSPRRPLQICGSGLGCGAKRVPLSPSHCASGQHDALPLNYIALACQNLEERVLSVPPKSDIEPPPT